MMMERRLKMMAKDMKKIKEKEERRENVVHFQNLQQIF